MSLQEALDRLGGKEVLDADDALSVRKMIYGDTLVVTREEVEALFKLNAGAKSVSLEWRMLFVEAVTDLIVHQQQPTGYVDEVQADWLIGLVSAYPRIRPDELEMLVHVLEAADKTPERLSAFVLELVRTFSLWTLKRTGRLGPAPLSLLKRVIFAEGGESNIAVTRDEAEVLFDINDALAGGQPDPAWRDFFVRAVAGSVLFETVWRPDAQRELREEAWLADTSVHPFARLGAAFGSGAHPLQAIRDGLADLGRMDFVNHDLEAAEIEHEQVEARASDVTDEEAHWLVARIGRSGGADPNEQALLDYIRENARHLSPELRTALDLQAAPVAA